MRDISMREKLKTLGGYALDRMGEASTWQGVGFFVTLAGCKGVASMDWGAAAAAGGMVSGAIKALLPDGFHSGDRLKPESKT